MAPYRDDWEARFLRVSAQAQELRSSGLDVHIALPCAFDWDAMSGDDRIRVCPGCAKYVYNLSAMTVEEAKLLVEQKGRELCVRFFRRHDGKIMTSDCARALRRREGRRTLALAFAAVAAVGGAVGWLEGGKPPPAPSCDRQVKTHFLLRPPPVQPPLRSRGAWTTGVMVPRPAT
jgi:hypothetical protein